MNENPYQTPQSEIDIRHGDNEHQFYVVSLPKFTILFFSTLGVYITYWFYKNWNYYKIYHHEILWPIPRGIFSIFFVHSLFEKIDAALKKNGKSLDWNPVLLAFAYMLAYITSQVLDRLAMKEIGSPYTDLFSILILPVMYLVFVKPQRAINLSQDDPKGSSNKNITGVNWVWIVLGLLFWVLVVVGLLSVFGFVDPELLMQLFFD